MKEDNFSVAFRVDSSIILGAGHVMRCLTLADALSSLGAYCHFVCRDHPGNLIPLIQQRGYNVAVLPLLIETEIDCLGASWQEDSEQTCTVLNQGNRSRWLVVDHYSIDERWERAAYRACERVLVIDDLANRRHEANLLLDQTLGRSSADYRQLTNPQCELRCGIANVLLREEFKDWRSRSLARRAQPSLDKILVSLGGIDKDNFTLEILKGLDQSLLPSSVKIEVVLGATSPWVKKLQQLASNFRFNIELKVAVNNMAELLTQCDLAIGAAGTSAWERCCLGVPSITAVIAENQRKIASELKNHGATHVLNSHTELKDELINAIAIFLVAPSRLTTMSRKAAMIVPSDGAIRLAGDMVRMMQ